jgi:hypothetical protein
MDDRNASALIPLRKSSIAVLSSRFFLKQALRWERRRAFAFRSQELRRRETVQTDNFEDRRLVM